MKHAILTALMLAIPFGLSAEEAEQHPVSLTFGEVKHFRDFEYSGMNEEKTTRIFERELLRYLDRMAPRYLEDHRLELHFTDIDLAGDVQPWRNHANRDIRYIESIYPPRAEFTYTLKDASGATVAEGEAKLIDLGFDFNTIRRMNPDPFEYEQDMIRRWLQREVRPLVRGETQS